MQIDSTLDFLSEGYTDTAKIADTTARMYGLSAVDVLEERERRQEILDNLKIVLEHLDETQKHVLLLSGSNVRKIDMADEIGVSHQYISDVYASISDTLRQASDEDRIQYLSDEIERLEKTSRGRHSKLYTDLKIELINRMDLREALKKLFVLLTPPESTKEMDGKTNMPAYPFERAMVVNCGMRDGLEDGRKVKKSIVKCFMPEYMSDTFHKDDVCCTLCATCKRKKDVVGRNGQGIYGTELTSK